MDRVFRIDEVALVQLDDEILAEGPVELWVVNDHLMVTRLHERTERVPVLRLNVIG